MALAEVRLWGKTVGAVDWNESLGVAKFEYDPVFAKSGIEVAPLMMPLVGRVYSFPSLPRQTFRGLPGLLADSLPDRFGNALIDAWLARQGRTADGFSPVERLCYVGRRGMGALEYHPVSGPDASESEEVDVAALVELASEILTRHSRIDGGFTPPVPGKSLQQIFAVGTSAGGARAKALIAWNPATDEVRSGHLDTDEGFSHWLLKFDGVSGNKDRELEDPKGYGLVEFAYYRMALAAGVEMSECRIIKENGRSHFMTKRFDRTENGAKIFMQSLGAVAHYDYNQPGAHSYEQAVQVMRQLGMSTAEVEQQFRRMTFNVVARNQDDHVKNITFLMNRKGGWRLSPAYDMTYSYNPKGDWTGTHQMTLNGKRDHFTMDDFRACAKTISLKHGQAEAIVAEVTEAVRRWGEFAADAGVSGDTAEKIRRAHRVKILG